MADGNLILAECTFTTVYLSDQGVYAMDVPADIELVPGETYTVRFDNTDYSCICSAQTTEITAVGNLSLFDPSLPGNNEPFIVLDYQGGDEITVFCFLDTTPTEHTLAIYEDAAEGGESEEPEGIGFILRDYKGEETTYYDLETLEPPNTSGESIKFLREDLVPETVEKTVELDFSDGDMVVTPEAGKVFSKVNITAPANLIPENIAEGVNIAGIAGALAGGSAKVAFGTLMEESSEAVTVEHGLGIVPDIVCTIKIGFITSYRMFQIGTSKAFCEKVGLVGYYGCASVNATTGHNIFSHGNNANYPMDVSGSGIVANDKTITFRAGDSLRLAENTLWFAIGGLA